MSAKFNHLFFPENTIVPLGPLNEEFVIPGKGVSLLPSSSEEIDLDAFFTMAIAQKVSDIHLRVDHPPSFRRNGDIIYTKLPSLTPKAMQRIARWLIPENLKPVVAKRHDIDFSIPFLQARFRVNLLYEMGQLAFVIRVIPTEIPRFESLGLPKKLLDFTTMHNGLVLVTGMTGSGKSTTLATLLEHINTTQSKHIITIEDPVEFSYQSKKAMITQRQLSIDTPSFPSGIKYALRQDPNVMLIGELRDRETALTCIKAAETGAMVFSTLHTSDAIQTINRLIDFFEPHEREAIRFQLANVLRGVVCQKLYKKADGSGCSAVAEILMITSTVRDYLLKNQIDDVYALMDEGRYDGMQTMNYALNALLDYGEITIEEALKVSNNPFGLKQRLKGAFHGAHISN